MIETCNNAQNPDIPSGFVLVELANILLHSAALTTEIEEVIAPRVSDTSSPDGDMIMKLQKLDMVRQLQGDIAKVLEEMSRSIANKPISGEELKQLISESKLGVVRNALASCAVTERDLQPIVEKQSIQDDGLDLF